MPIPKYDQMYEPFLVCLKDGLQHKVKEVKEYVATVMNVSDEERLEVLPSGRQFIFDNRIGWTRTYLKKAGLIDSPSRGVFKISKEGLKVLSKNSIVIDNKFLMKYDSFRDFIRIGAGNNGRETDIEIFEDTPQDEFDNAYKKIYNRLIDDLLSEIMKQDSAFFERMVVKLLEKMGYGGYLKDAGKVVGQSGDEGIDGIIREDKLGFSYIYIQAKRWNLDKKISNAEVRGFAGALSGKGASKGLFITTAQFSQPAITCAKEQRNATIILVDGHRLAELMIEYNTGVTTESVYEIKRIDTDFFNMDDE